MPEDAHDPRRNAILRSLPDNELSRVVAAGRVCDVEMRAEVYDKDRPVEAVYFPLTAVFSYVADAGDDATIEVATIGPEGMVGLPAFLGVTHSPHATFCQIPGTAVRIRVDALHRLQVGDGQLHDRLHRYTQAIMVQMAQNVACIRAHPVEQRAARWLLTTHDRVGADTFPLTQEFLAQMLGVRRPTVSMTAQALSERGLITYRRGVLTIRDRDGLRAASCECYDIIRRETDRLTNPGEH